MGEMYRCRRFLRMRETALLLKSMLFWLRGSGSLDGSLEITLSPQIRESVFSLCTFTLMRVCVRES